MIEAQKQLELRKYFFKPSLFLDGLSPEIWNELQSVIYAQTFPKKSLIYSEGSHPRSLYIIRDGIVKVYIMNNVGAEQIIYFLGKDEVFGHRSIVCDQPSPVFVEAINECTVDCIPRYHFVEFLRKSSELNDLILYYLGYEFSVFVNKISSFAQKSVSERVALALLVLNEKFNDDPFKEMQLNFTREDLASYIGTATENLIRQLKLLKEARAISIQGRKIVLEETDLLWEQAKIL